MSAPDPEFATLLYQLLEDKGFAQTPTEELGKIGHRFAEWADAEGNRLPAEKMLDKVYPALQAAIQSPEKAASKPEALGFWLGKYYWKQADKKEEALKWFARSLVDSPPTRFRLDDRRFNDVASVIGRITDAKQNQYWAEMFEQAIPKRQDPKDRTQRQWELAFWKYKLIQTHRDLVKENLGKEELHKLLMVANEKLKDANDMVFNNKGKHAYLTCEGHAMSIQAIYEISGFEEKLEEKARDLSAEEEGHWRELGRLLSQKETFKEWGGASKWAKPVKNRMDQLAPDKAKQIQDNIDKYLAPRS